MWFTLVELANQGSQLGSSFTTNWSFAARKITIEVYGKPAGIVSSSNRLEKQPVAQYRDLHDDVMFN